MCAKNQFKVKPLPGYQVGDVISNTAYIYFGFNPAIATNTFTSKFVQQLGTEDVGQARFKFYPNPAKDQVFIGADANFENVTIYDVVGKRIRTVRASGTSATVDVSDIGTDIYFIEVGNGNSRNVSNLIIG